jgi:Domain of unknown function (DUF4410)
MKSRSRMVSGLLALAFVAGCASTEVVEEKPLVTAERLPRPNRILVYNFAATPADAPELASQTAGSPPQTAQEIQAGRQLGAYIAGYLAAEIRDMGLAGAEVPIGTPARLNDIIIKGYILSVHEGSATRRMALGFGAGASELRTAVEGFQMTSQGLRKLGSGTVDSAGNQTPGAAVGVVGLIATGSPAGLLVSTGMKAYGEMSGSSGIEGRAAATAQEIAASIKPRFRQQGWIQ